MTTIRADASSIAIINTFIVSPERADALARVLTEATEDVICGATRVHLGKLRLSFHGQRAVTYAQRRSTGDFEAMQSNQEATAHMKRAAPIDERFDPVLSAVAYVDDNPDVA